MPSEAALYSACEADAYDWNVFFMRVLPQPFGESWWAHPPSIHNEDQNSYSLLPLDVTAPRPEREAALQARGWPDGRLPSKKELLEHILWRVEYEYAEHLHDHSFTPGERCEACNVVCACSAFDASLTGLEPNSSPDTPVESDAEDDLAGVDLVGDFSTYEYGSDEDQAHDATPLRGDV